MTKHRDDGHITRLIESGDSRFDSPAARFDSPADDESWLSERDALRYNDHPGHLMAEVPQDEWGRVLRRIEEVVEDWESRQSLGQRDWVRRGRPPYLGTVEAARLIVQRLEH